MKAIPVLIFNLFLFLFSYGQFEIVVDDFRFSDGPYKLKRTQSGQYILINSGDGDIYFRNSFTVVDEAGTEVFSHSISYDAHFSTLYDMVELHDSSYLFIQSACNDGRRISKFDPSWNLIQRYRPGFVECFGGVLSDNSTITYYPNNTFYARISEFGDIIWEADLLIDAVLATDVVVTSEDIIIVIGPYYNHIHFLSPDDGYPYAMSYSIPIYERLEILKSDLLLGQKNDSIFLFSAAAGSQFDVMIDSIGAVGFSGDNIIDFSISGDNFAILTSKPHAYVYDETLALQSDFALPEGHHFNLIALAPDGVVLAGTTRFGSLV